MLNSEMAEYQARDQEILDREQHNTGLQDGRIVERRKNIIGPADIRKKTGQETQTTDGKRMAEYWTGKRENTGHVICRTLNMRKVEWGTRGRQNIRQEENIIIDRKQQNIGQKTDRMLVMWRTVLVSFRVYLRTRGQYTCTIAHTPYIYTYVILNKLVLSYSSCRRLFPQW